MWPLNRQTSSWYNLLYNTVAPLILRDVFQDSQWMLEITGLIPYALLIAKKAIKWLWVGSIYSRNTLDRRLIQILSSTDWDVVSSHPAVQNSAILDLWVLYFWNFPFGPFDISNPDGLQATETTVSETAGKGDWSNSSWSQRLWQLFYVFLPHLPLLKSEG